MLMKNVDRVNNLKFYYEKFEKFTRKQLKSVKGGISIACLEKQRYATCYATIDECTNDSNSINGLNGCERVCNKFCYQ